MTNALRLQVVAGNLALDAACAEAVRALREAQIAVVVLKGPGLAARLYADDLAGRRYSDIDLLVAPERFGAAGDVLAGLGYEDFLAGIRVSEAASRIAWPRKRAGPLPVAIDLHRGFTYPGDDELLWQALSAHTESLDVAGEAVPVPDASGCALVVALHAARPGPAPNKVDEDLRRALVHFDESQWREAARRAEVAGVLAVFATGLARLPAAAELVSRLGVAATPDPETRLVSAGSPRGSITLARLASARSWRRRARLAADALVPTPNVLRARSSLARRGRAGLAGAYLARPAVLVWRLPGAVGAWAQVRPPPSPRRRLHRLVCRAVSAASVLGHPALAWWTWSALRRSRHNLANVGLDGWRLAPPRRHRGGAEVVERVLRLATATCLERALVVQAWRAGHGEQPRLIIGVTQPSLGFQAHAWLEGEDNHGEGFVELLQRQPPCT